MTSKITNLLRTLQGPSLAYQLYNISRFGFLLLTSVALARLFPDKVVVTQYEQLLLLGGALTFFWVSGLFDGFVVLYRGGSEELRRGLTGQTFVAGCALSLLSAAAFLWLGSTGLVGDLPFQLLLPFALFLFFDLSSQLLVFYLLVRAQSKFLLLYGFFSFLAYFLLLVVPLWQGGGFGLALWAIAGLALLKFLLLLAVSGKDLHAFRWDRGQFLGILKVSGPIALAILLSQSAQYVDSFLVESQFPDEFAVFRYGARELPLVLLLANAMSVVRAGDISNALKEGHLEEGLARLRSSSIRLIHSMFPLSMLLLALSLPIFSGVFGEGFSGSVPVFDLYLLLVVPRLLFPQSVIRGHLRTVAMTMSAAVELVLNVGLSLLLMQYWGIAGIAGATVIAFMVEKILLVAWCKWKLNLNPSAYTPLFAWGGWTTAIVLLWVLKQYV